MSDELNSNENTGTSLTATQTDGVYPFSPQPTGMAETAFADTVGLSMHNAITNQQNAQMIAQASVTNACARLLKVPSLAIPMEENLENESPKNRSQIIEAKATKPEANVTSAESAEEQAKNARSKPRKGFSFSNFFGSNKDKQTSENNRNSQDKIEPEL